MEIVPTYPAWMYLHMHLGFPLPRCIKQCTVNCLRKPYVTICYTTIHRTTRILPRTGLARRPVPIRSVVSNKINYSACNWYKSSVAMNHFIGGKSGGSIHYKPIQCPTGYIMTEHACTVLVMVLMRNMSMPLLPL